MTNPPLKTSDIVNLLYSSIINYETVHKPNPTGNYMQSDNNEKDDKIFFTNCQY